MTNEVNNTYVLNRGETKSFSVSISKEVAERLDKAAESHGEKSWIIAEALNRRLHRGQLARIEQKLDILLADDEVPHRGNSPEVAKNKRDWTSTLDEQEKQVVEEVMNRSKAQGRHDPSFSSEEKQEIVVSLPVGLVNEVKEAVDGGYGQGRYTESALRDYFENGSWLDQLEQKADLALASRDIPVPAPTGWTERVRANPEQPEHEPYAETLSVRDRIDQSGLTPDQQVQLNPSQANPQEVKQRSQYWAGFICAIIRWEFENGERTSYKYDELGELVDEWFDVTPATRSKVVELVCEQMVEEYHAQQMEAYLRRSEEARDRSWYPELKQTGIQKPKLFSLGWETAEQTAQLLVEQAEQMRDADEEEDAYRHMAAWFRRQQD